MKLDEDKFYTKVIVLDEIYNFVVDNFFVQDHLLSQIFVNILEIKS